MNKYILILFFILTAKYSASQGWTKLGNGLSTTVYKMEVYKNKLYVQGGFYVPGSKTMRVGRWDGQSWDSVGLGISTGIYGFGGFKEYRNELYMGGGFSKVAGVTGTQNFAKWNDTIWSGFDFSPNNNVLAMEVYKDELYLGGSFANIGGMPRNRIARWDGVNFNYVGSGVHGSIERVYAMAVYKGELYVGGEFYFGGDTLSPYLARWDGTNWRSMPMHTNGTVMSLFVDTIRDILYIGGGFTYVGTIPAFGIAQWDGKSFKSVGNSPRINGVGTMDLYQGELHAGGRPGNNNLATDTAVSRWDGKKWHPYIPGPNSDVMCMKTYKDELYIGGYFNYIGNTKVNYIAKWYTPPVSTASVLNEHKDHLGSNVPNPFSESTLIPYCLPSDVRSARLAINDVFGREVSSFALPLGESNFEISNTGFSTGIYFYKLFADGKLMGVKKMVVGR